MGSARSDRRESRDARIDDQTADVVRAQRRRGDDLNARAAWAVPPTSAAARRQPRPYVARIALRIVLVSASEYGYPSGGNHPGSIETCLTYVSS